MKNSCLHRSFPYSWVQNKRGGWNKRGVGKTSWKMIDGGVQNKQGGVKSQDLRKWSITQKTILQEIISAFLTHLVPSFHLTMFSMCWDTFHSKYFLQTRGGGSKKSFKHNHAAREVVPDNDWEISRFSQWCLQRAVELLFITHMKSQKSFRSKIWLLFIGVSAFLGFGIYLKMKTLTNIAILQILVLKTLR